MLHDVLLNFAHFSGKSQPPKHFLVAGEEMNQSDRLTSPNNQYWTRLNSDGTLLIEKPNFDRASGNKSASRKVIWRSKNLFRGQQPYKLKLDASNRLYIADKYGSQVWWASLKEQGHPGGKLKLLDQAELQLEDGSGKILWQSETGILIYR